MSFGGRPGAVYQDKRDTREDYDVGRGNQTCNQDDNQKGYNEEGICTEKDRGRGIGSAAKESPSRDETGHAGSRA